MPRTVNEGFVDFLTRLTPFDSETSAAKGHSASIKACLENELTVERFFRSGSFGNGTSIAGYSDVDYFACFPANELSTNSGRSLLKIRKILRGRFHFTPIKMRNPSILLQFGSDNEFTDIVPACYYAKMGKYNIYEIPDRNGKWLKTCPDGHIKYVSEINENLSYKLKDFIRFIKAWKYYNNVPISSFYLELRIAKYFKEELYIDFNWDISKFFDWLFNNKLPFVQDPLGVSGYIYPFESDAQYNEIMAKLRRACTWSKRAILAENKDNIKYTYFCLRKIFGFRFPTYYKGFFK